MKKEEKLDQTQEIWDDVAPKKELEQQITKDQEVWEDVKIKRSVPHMIINVLLVLFIIFVIFNAFFGSLNLKLIYDGKEPKMLLREESYQDGETDVRVYHFGLYKIVTRTESSEMKLSLRLWFIDNGDKGAK